MNTMDMNSKVGMDGVRQQLSCLVDGELDATELDALLSAVGPEEVSDCWQAYHLIGNALRAPERVTSGCDAQWLQRFRQRLQAEARAPLTLPATGALPGQQVDPELTRRSAANDGAFRWKMVAGFASFAAVAAVGWNLFGTLQPAPAPEAAVLAQNEVSAPAAQTRNVSWSKARVPSGFWSPAQPPYTMVLRNPELDRMLVQQAEGNPDPAAQRATEFFRNAGYEGMER